MFSTTQCDAIISQIKLGLIMTDTGIQVIYLVLVLNIFRNWRRARPWRSPRRRAGTAAILRPAILWRSAHPLTPHPQPCGHSQRSAHVPEHRNNRPLPHPAPRRPLYLAYVKFVEGAYFLQKEKSYTHKDNGMSLSQCSNSTR